MKCSCIFELFLSMFFHEFAVKGNFKRKEGKGDVLLEFWRNPFMCQRQIQQRTCLPAVSIGKPVAAPPNFGATRFAFCQAIIFHGIHFGDDQRLQMYANFKGFAFKNALFGLVI